MPFGLSIAASFLPILHEPFEINDFETMPSEEEINAQGFQRGGECVDRELRAIVIDMYNLFQKLDIQNEK